MLFSIILPFVFFGLVAGATYGLFLDERKRAAVKPKPTGKPVEEKKRSVPSDIVLGVFDDLPVENRPVSRSELEASLDALDFKYGIEAVHQHFEVGTGQRWANMNRCSCRGSLKYNYDGKDCKFPEYQQLYNSMYSVRLAIKQREKALAEAAHQAEVEGRKFDLDRITDMTERFRNEANALEAVTRELEK